MTVGSMQRSSQAIRSSVFAIAVAASVLSPHALNAQQQQVGPKTLYPVSEKPDAGNELPLVMRDAVNYMAFGTRLLAIEPRIMGGEPAPSGIYPWIASLGLKGSNPRLGHFCGGAFIAPEWVVTAAHCVKSDSAGKIQVIGGADTLDQGGAVFLVDRVIVHEKYDNVAQDFDIALLHLTKRFSGRTIRLLPAADAERLAADGILAIAAGWGYTGEDGEVSNTLRHVTVQIVSNAACNGLAAYGGGISKEMLCAGFPQGGKDSCQGDSGGPLIVPDQAGGFFQAGVVSFGEGCGRPHKFGVYTRVSVVQAWVAGKIGDVLVASKAETTQTRAAKKRVTVGAKRPTARKP